MVLTLIVMIAVLALLLALINIYTTTESGIRFMLNALVIVVWALWALRLLGYLQHGSFLLP